MRVVEQQPDVKVFLKRFIDNEDDWNEAVTYLGLNGESMKLFLRGDGEKPGQFFPTWGTESIDQYLQTVTVLEERMGGDYAEVIYPKDAPLYLGDDFRPSYELGLLEVMKGVYAVTTNINRNGNPGSATVKLSLSLLSNNIDDKTLLAISAFDLLNADYSKILNMSAEGISQLKQMGVTGDSATAKRIVEMLSTRKLNILQSNSGGNSMFVDSIRTIFRPMDKIQIWFRKRHTTGYNFPSDYAVAFTGLISDSTVSYGGGKVEVTLGAEDTLKWLRITRVNVSPSPNVGASESGQKAIAFTTTFAKENGSQIIKDLVLGRGVNANGTPWLQRIIQNDSGDNITQYYVKNMKTGNGDWRVVTFSDSKNTKPVGLAGYEQLEQASPITAIGEFQLIDKKSYATIKTTVDSGDPAVKKTKTSDGNPIYIRETLQAGMFFRLDTDFDKSRLLIPEKWIADWAPYKNLFQSAFQLWESDFKFRLDIAKEVANATDFEFFADASGTIHYRPPLYMLTPGLSYTWLFNYGETDITKFSPYFIEDQYFIDDIDVVSDSFTTSDRDIKTYVSVTGQPNYFDMEDFLKVNTTYYYNPVLVNRYGVRYITKQLPMLSGLDAGADPARTSYAQAWMNRQNASINTGSVTIAGTPELEVGRTIGLIGNKDNIVNTIKKINASSAKSLRGDETKVTAKISGAINSLNQDIIEQMKRLPVYYIDTISHSYTQGKTFTTTLGLTHGRVLGNRYGTGFLGFGVGGDDAQTMDAMMDAIDYNPPQKVWTAMGPQGGIGLKREKWAIIRSQDASGAPAVKYYSAPETNKNGVAPVRSMGNPVPTEMHTAVGGPAIWKLYEFNQNMLYLSGESGTPGKPWPGQ